MHSFVATNSTCIVLFILPQHGSLCSFKFNIYTLFSQYQLSIYCFVVQYYLNMFYLCCYTNNKDSTSQCQQRRYARVSSNSNIIIILLTSNPKCFLHHFRPSFIGSSTLHVQSILLTRRQDNCIWGLRLLNVFILLPTSWWMNFKVCICFRFSR